MQRHNEKQIN